VGVWVRGRGKWQGVARGLSRGTGGWVVNECTRGGGVVLLFSFALGLLLLGWLCCSGARSDCLLSVVCRLWGCWFGLGCWAVCLLLSPRNNASRVDLPCECVFFLGFEQLASTVFECFCAVQAGWFLCLASGLCCDSFAWLFNIFNELHDRFLRYERPWYSPQYVL
jgi:hypothetical protein